MSLFDRFKKIKKNNVQNKHSDNDKGIDFTSIENKIKMEKNEEVKKDLEKQLSHVKIVINDAQNEINRLKHIGDNLSEVTKERIIAYTIINKELKGDNRFNSEDEYERFKIEKYMDKNIDIGEVHRIIAEDMPNYCPLTKEDIDAFFEKKGKYGLFERYELHNKLMYDLQCLKTTNPKSLELIPDFERCANENISDNTKANCYRVIGEIYEGNNDIEKTLKYFEKALAISERVGIKRKYNKLLKEYKS
ncbi:MAG: hypothetical protein ACRCVG_04405 [Methanobacteriaceae archaeon]